IASARLHSRDSVSSLVRLLEDDRSGTLVLAGHGYGAIMAALVAARLGSRVTKLVIVNAVPPHHYAIPFLDLASDAELEGFLQLIGYPGTVDAASITSLRAGVRVSSSHQLTRVELACEVAVFRASRSLWFSYWSSQRWEDDTQTKQTRFFDFDGDHFSPVDSLLRSLLAETEAQPTS
ncbi:MAG: hypothetical protein KC431_15595, partial [Myxococcales bacterium]|nr:hypothetical protein [Myxococcales bacterium]